MGFRPVLSDPAPEMRRGDKPHREWQFNHAWATIFIEKVRCVVIEEARIVQIAEPMEDRNRCERKCSGRSPEPDGCRATHPRQELVGPLNKLGLIAMCGNLMACSPDVLNDSGPMLGIVAAAKECGRDTVPLEHVEIAIDTAADRVSAAAIDAERRQIASHLNGGPVDMDSNRDDCPSSVRPARHLLRVHALTSP